MTITHHPDVRRSLITQKSFAEGLRSLVLFTASVQDRVWGARLTGGRDEAAERLNDLLLPIVKGYGSERSWVLLGTESLQTFGGSGFLTDYPIEQYVRDAKIDTLYEGTTAIQGQDLFFRKIVKDRGPRARATCRSRSPASSPPRPATVSSRRSGRSSSAGSADVGAIVEHLVSCLPFGDPDTEDARQIYAVGLNTTRLLMAMGDVTCAWLLLRGAEVALTRTERSAHLRRAALLRGQGGLRPLVRPHGAAQAGRRAGDRRSHRSDRHGSSGGCLLAVVP